MESDTKKWDISNRFLVTTVVITILLILTELVLNVQDLTVFNIVIQDVLGNLDGFFALVSIIGTPFSFIFIGLIIYWSVDSKLGYRLMILLITVSAIVESLKMLLHTERPFWVDSEVAVEESQRTTSYGMPSGHSTTPVVYFGMVLSKKSENWKWVISIFVVTLIGLSRMVLGVHSIFQVIGGWMLGFTAIIFYYRFGPSIEERLVSQNLTNKIILSLVTSLIFAVLGIISSYVADNVNILTDWETNFGEFDEDDFIGRSRLQTILALSGLLFGWLAGSIFLNLKEIKFEVSGKIWQKIVRSLIALPITLFLFVSAPESDSDSIFYLSKYLFGFLAGLFATGLAPWIFVKLKLIN